MPINKVTRAVPKYIAQEIKKIYASNEGKMTRDLNKTAVSRSALNFSLQDYRFVKASKEDLKILLSVNKKDALKRCLYISPKTLKTYHIVLKETLSDGRKSVRILDETGAFVKEALITPKKVVVLDCFKYKTRPLNYDGTAQCAHGELTKHLMQKANPFNEYEFIDIGIDKSHVSTETILSDLLARLKSKEKIDVLSCIYAGELSYEMLEKMCKTELVHKPMSVQKRVIKDTLKKLLNSSDEQIVKDHSAWVEGLNTKNAKDLREFAEIYNEIKLYDEIHRRGVKIFMGAGNKSGKNNEFLNYALLSDGVEGVGAINAQGKLEAYSSSKKTLFSPHVECGDIHIDYTPKGFRISSLYGADIPYTKKAFASYKETSLLSSESNELTNVGGTYFYNNLPLTVDIDTHLVSPATIVRNGTSFATAKRTAEFTKYEMLKDIIP